VNDFTRRFVSWHRFRTQVSLEEGLVSDNPWRYSTWRLRFIFIRAVVLACLYLIELKFFYEIFNLRYYVSVLTYYYIYSFGSAFWWGAMEPLRRRIRVHIRNGTPAYALQELRPWLFMSVVIALGVLGLAGLLVYRRMAVTGVFSVFDLAILMLLGRLALDIVVRTYQAGVQAFRRIYRPMWMVIGIDIIDVLGVLMLWGLMGPFAFSAAYGLGGILSAALTVGFTYRVYRRSPLATESLFKGKMRLKLFWEQWPSMITSGLAIALTRIDLIMIIWMLFASFTGRDGLFVATWLHLAAPAMFLCLSWPRPFMLDLDRLHVQLPGILYSRFKRHLVKLAVLVAVVAVGLAAFVAVNLFVVTPMLTNLLMAMIPFAILWALSARNQMIAFMEARGVVALLSSFVPMLGVLMVVVLWSLSRTDYALVMGVVTVAVVWGMAKWVNRPRPRSDIGPEDRLLEPYAFFEEVIHRSGPTRLVWLVSNRSVPCPMRKIAERVTTELADALVTIPEPTRLLVALPEGGPGERVDGMFIRMAVGLIQGMGSTQVEPDGKKALALAIEKGGLGEKWKRMAHDSWTAADLDTAKSRFQKAFPSGIVMTAKGGGVHIPAFGRSKARKIVVGIFNALRMKKNLREDFDITIAAPGGRPSEIFLVPRDDTDPVARSSWRNELEKMHMSRILACLRLSGK